MGCIAIASFFVGFVGSFYKRWCLGVYLMLGTLVTLSELGIVLTLFFNLDGVLNNMKSHAFNSLPAEEQKYWEDKATAADEPLMDTWTWSRCAERGACRAGAQEACGRSEQCGALRAGAGCWFSSRVG